jgi:hypothetical protein
MKGQFFVVATVIMIITLMSLVRYFYDFSSIDLPEIRELGELNYIPFIKDSLNYTVLSFNGDCVKLEEDINNTKNMIENGMIKRGIFLNISYVFNCPPPDVLFNFTIKSAGLYTETVFRSP